MKLTSDKVLLMTQEEWLDFDMAKLKKMMSDGDIVSWKIVDIDELEYNFG